MQTVGSPRDRVKIILAHKFAFVPPDMVHRRVIDRFHTSLLWS